MKKILIFVLVSVALFSSCSKSHLEIEQKGVTPYENFYQTDEEAEQALMAAYQSFMYNVCGYGDGFIYVPFRFAFNLCGDDMYAAGEFFGDNDFAGQMNEFRYDNASDVIKNTYYGLYYAIYNCNLVIDHFKDGLPGGNKTNVTKRVVAEARVLRAYMHMMLAIGWGTPPLVDHVLDGAALPYNCNAEALGADAKTHEQLLLWCAKECEEAEPDLDERTSINDKNGAVKITKGFANAVAGKSYLFAGDKANAATALKKVITSQKYKLVPGDRYWENFHIEGDCNEEKVFEANIEDAHIDKWGGVIQRSTWMEANIWNWRSDHFVANPSSTYSSIDGWGGCGVPQRIADEFIAHDGANSPRVKATIKSIEDIVYETTYGIAEVDAMTRAQKEASDKLGIGMKGLYGQSFYMPLKPVCRTSDLFGPGDNCRLNNFVIMRYAEVLLLYAEAAMTSDPTGALEAINQVRDRAGLAQLSAAQFNLDAIKAEKKIELWLEGCRWPDMVRWGDFDQAKKAGQEVTVLYDKTFRAPAANDEGIKWLRDDQSQRFYTVVTHAAKDRGDDIGFKAGKHELFPFPFAATSINPNLKQNPGWE